MSVVQKQLQDGSDENLYFELSKPKFHVFDDPSTLIPNVSAPMSAVSWTKSGSNLWTSCCRGVTSD